MPAGSLLGLFMWGHMSFVSSILISKDAMWTVTKAFEGYFVFGRAYPVDRLGDRRHHHRAVHGRTPSWPCASSPRDYGQYRVFRGHKNLMRHEDTDAVVLAGRHRIRAVLPGSLAPLHRCSRIRTGIGPYESADRVWSEHVWPLYLVLLFCVEIHGGIGLYRLAVKWGWFAGRRPAVAAGSVSSRLKWAITAFFLVLGLATLAAYIKIGIEHRDRVGEEYVPSWVTAAARRRGIRR